MYDQNQHNTPSPVAGQARLRGVAMILIGVLMPLTASAQLVIEDAWVRAMPPTQKMTAGYGVIKNTGTSTITVTGATSNIAPHTTLHATVREGDSVRMEAMGPAALEPGQSISLEPGGAHIMLMGISNMPAVGDNVQLCITTDEQNACVQAPVLRSAPNEAQGSHDHHSMKH